MAMTSAERQKRYRQKARDSGDSRINTAVSAGARACLKRIAKHKGLSEREALEAILENVEARLIPNSNGSLQKAKPATADGYSNFRQQVISTGILKTQRAYIRNGYRDRQVRAYFKQLEAEGLIKKKGQSFILTN